MLYNCHFSSYDSHLIKIIYQFRRVCGSSPPASGNKKATLNINVNKLKVTVYSMLCEGFDFQHFTHKYELFSGQYTYENTNQSVINNTGVFVPIPIPYKQLRYN